MLTEGAPYKLTYLLTYLLIAACITRFPAIASPILNFKRLFIIIFIPQYILDLNVLDYLQAQDNTKCTRVAYVSKEVPYANGSTMLVVDYMDIKARSFSALTLLVGSFDLTRKNPSPYDL